MTMPEPAADAPSPEGARRTRLIPGSLAGRVVLPARDLEQRLEDIVSTFQEFAREVRRARPISPRGDVVDAIAGGVNFLGGARSLLHGSRSVSPTTASSRSRHGARPAGAAQRADRLPTAPFWGAPVPPRGPRADDDGFAVCSGHRHLKA